MLASLARSLVVLGAAASLLPGCKTFTVNSLADAPDAHPGDGTCARAAVANSDGLTTGLCTLRAAVMEADATIWRDTIQVPAGVYHLTLPYASGGGHLEITHAVWIHGAGASATTIDQDVSDLVLYVHGAKAVQINHLTVQGGDTQFGGGVRLDSGGNLEMADSVIRDNFAFTGGGGMLIGPGSKATLRRVSILENTANGAFGGGLLNQGELWVYDSTIADNVSNRAGGIRNEGNMNLRNVTVSGNEAVSPQAGTGGISQNGFAVLNNVTLTGNTGVGNDPASFRGGGIQIVAGKTTVVKNSIIAGNDGGLGPNDCDGTLSGDSKYNLVGDSDGCTIPSYLSTFKLDVSPGLGTLGIHGGSTQTHVPNSGSEALNAGYGYPPPAADACQGTDQRGIPRPQGAGGCDLGAVEVTPAAYWVTGFVLVDAATNTDIRPLLSGDTLDLSELPPQLSVRASVTGGPGSVVFGLDADPSFQTEGLPPYVLGGDAPLGDYTPVSLATGTHTVMATPFAGAGGSGAAGGGNAVTFLVKS